MAFSHASKRLTNAQTAKCDMTHLFPHIRIRNSPLESSNRVPKRKPSLLTHEKSWSRQDLLTSISIISAGFFEYHYLKIEKPNPRITHADPSGNYRISNKHTLSSRRTSSCRSRSSTVTGTTPGTSGAFSSTLSPSSSRWGTCPTWTSFDDTTSQRYGAGLATVYRRMFISHGLRFWHKSPCTWS